MFFQYIMGRFSTLKLHHFHFRILLVALACGILILDDLVVPIDDVTLLPGFLSALISALITSLALKLSPLKEKVTL